MNNRLLRALGVSALLGATASSTLHAAVLTESFDSGLPLWGGTVSTGRFFTLSSGSWYSVNHSDVIGLLKEVSEGDPANELPAHQGANYATFSFDLADGDNTISAWLISPVQTFYAGDTVSFYTRTATGSAFPDSLAVRLSGAGASVNVGTTSSDVGDFSVTLGQINPGLAIGGYPETYVHSVFTVSATVTGRMAFHYLIPHGGPLGSNGNYIAIDTLTIVPEPSTCAGLASLAVLGFVACRRRRRHAAV